MQTYSLGPAFTPARRRLWRSRPRLANSIEDALVLFYLDKTLSWWLFWCGSIGLSCRFFLGLFNEGVVNIVSSKARPSSKFVCNI